MVLDKELIVERIAERSYSNLLLSAWLSYVLVEPFFSLAQLLLF